MAAVELSGESFKLRAKIPPFVMMRFARSSREATANPSTMDQLAAMLDLLEGVIAKSEWARFTRIAADIEDEDAMLNVINQVFEALADRPTGQPSESSDGLTTTAPKSESQPVASVTSLPPIRPDVVLAARRSGLISVSA